MILLAHDLRDTISQELTATKDQDIVTVRPHLLLYNAPTGNVKMQVTDESGNVLNESIDVDLTTISTLNYFHGYVRFDIPIPVRTGRVFRLQLAASSGYAYSEASFVSWCNDYDLRKYSVSYSLGDNDAPLDIELWQQRSIGLVRELDFADGFESSAAPSSNVEFDLTNNQAAPADVTDMIFDFNQFQEVTIGYAIERRDGIGDERIEPGTLKLIYRKDAAAWDTDPERETEGDVNAGITFSVIAGTGQVQYTSDDFSGQTEGFIKWQVNERFAPGV